MSSTPRADPVFLRSGTKVEPLLCRWYAWSHLVAPMQAALNVAFRYQPLLQSFISHPGEHAAAAQDPAFLGAPIVHLKQSDAPAVQALARETADRCAEWIRIANDLATFSARLRSATQGSSLDPFYEQVPHSLAGLVELGYDVDNRPVLRVIEPLAYAHLLSNAGAQEIGLCSTPDARRGFFLNTPRIDAPDRLVLRVPFADRGIDLLARSRIDAVPFEQIAGALDPGGAAGAHLREFFTPAAPVRHDPHYAGREVRIRYFGQACVLVQTAKVSVLVDPVLTWDRDERLATLTFDDLPDFIDYVFLTHVHVDHFCPEVLLQLRGRIGRLLVPRNNAGSIADPSPRLMLKALGFDNVVALEEFEKLDFDDGSIVSLPFLGEHADLSIYGKHGMFLDVKGRRLLFLADSDCVDRALYRRMADLVGRADTVFIGMECHGAPLTWLYGPYLASRPSRKVDESRRLSGCNAERAWAVAEAFGCKQSFVYAMGQEPWLQHLSGLSYSPDSIQLVESDNFVRRCRERGIPSERLYGCREMLV